MPQVDLETLVSACTGVVSCDNKIACETLAANTTTTTADNYNHQHYHNVDETDRPEIAPESFWLSKDAELDWFDRNAFIERKDSTKGNSHSTNLNPNINHNSNSQRFSNLKSKPSIIGLPKPQKTCFIDTRRHGKPGNTRLFPKRSGSVSKSDSSVIEPSSPKVSCMGRVRSKKDRNRRLKNRQRSGRLNVIDSEREKNHEKKQINGFLSSFRAIFRANKKGKDASIKSKDLSRKGSRKGSKTTAVKTSDIRDRLPATEREAYEPAAEPVGLGGMKRFASGRKSESWIE